MSSREPGAVLDGKYEIVQRLGSGGMGEVHLVRHLHLQELRVVKILRQDLATDPSAQARFLREARLATQVKHPNVAILYDFARLPDGSFYMVWEHIEGQDVGDRIRRHGPFPVPVALQLGIQALRGLEAIHSAGVIHRDVSPDNLMITEDRRGQFRVKIIDLGLAKALGPDSAFEITQVGMFMGKLQYCSPEQAGTVRGESLDRRSDLYSFALVLYEMLVGLPPFDSENQHGFIFKRLSEDPLPLVGRNPRVAVPAELDRVVRRALERDRERRYPDAVTFIQALEDVARGLHAAATQEIPALAVSTAGAGSAAGAPAAGTARPASEPPTPMPQAPPRQRSTSEMSRAERAELLAQIDRAARRVREGSQVVPRIELALSSGRLEEARLLLQQVEVANPRAAGLDELRWRLQQAEELAAQRRRVDETEQVLAGYLERRQLPLARLALETLLELAPAHPRREEYEGTLAALSRDAEAEKRFGKAAAAIREAIAREDLKAARRDLDALVRAGGPADLVEALRGELTAAERAERRTGELEEHRRRFDEALAARRLPDAEQELAALSGLGLSRLMQDSLKVRLAEVRSAATAGERLAEFERRYGVMMEHADWYGAREIALELERDLPSHPRAAAMFAEVAERESEHQRRQAVEQGVRQVETFIQQGDARKAELALKVLLQMDPENRNRRRLEKQVRALAGR